MVQPTSPYSDLLARVPLSEHSRTIDGVSTHWWEYGAAKKVVDVVLVHGFRGDHHGLEPLIAGLGPRVRAVIPDLPGFGTSSSFATEATIQAYAAWLVAFCAQVAPGAAVLGHSFGSIVVAAARARGLRSPRTILINPIAANALQGPRGLLTRLAVGYYKFAAWLPERLGYALLKNRGIVRIMSVTMAKTKDKKLRRWIHHEHDSYFSVFDGRRAVLEAFQASVTHDVSEFVDGLDGPTLLIVAEHDDITPLKKQFELAEQLPHAQVSVIKDVGHLVHYETPLEATDAIRDFLSLPERFS